MPVYTAYGLGIDSYLTLPELVAGANKIDLTIKCDCGASAARSAQSRGKSPSANSADQNSFGVRGRTALTELRHRCDRDKDAENSEFYYWRNEEEVGLYWQKLGTFLIRSGKEIIIAPVPGVNEKDLHPALLGACMAVALQQKGYLILHASAVRVNGKAIAFIGNKGWGKSTIASAFIALGYQFITDDVLAISLNGNTPVVYPSFPQLKLCPDAIVAMGEDPETLPRVMSQTSKRQYKLSQDFDSDPVALQSIYLLGKAAELKTTEIAAGDSILPLLAHSYGARFGKKLLHLGEAEHFLQCSKLANQVGIYALQRPSDISLLEDTVNLIQSKQ